MPVTPHPDDDPLHRISLELRRQLADTLTAALPGDMQGLLDRLERVELEWHDDVTGKRQDEVEPPGPFA